MKRVLIVKASLLAAFLLGGVIAFSASADAVSPWYGPGGVKPIPQGDRERERRQNLYGEQRFIRKLYQGFLNRQPSPNELRFWSDRLGRDANPTELVQEFMDSDEFFIRQSYRGLLGREPEPSGMEAYQRALRGGKSRAFVVEEILSSQEFRSQLR